MNYLAHFFLSDSEDCLIGNLLGDFVKGVAEKITFPPDIKRGIILHREIDAFTDVHPITQVSKKKIHDEHSLYSGILIDVFYDHFLAVNFEKFSKTSLIEFAKSAYEIIQRKKDILPEKVSIIVDRMIKYNWLVNYTYINVIERVLERISKQLTHENSLNKCIFYLNNYYRDFEDEFLNFFPKLIEFVHSFNENFLY